MNNLKTILKEKGLKQIWVAKKLGVTREAVSNWIRGKNFPSMKNTIKLAVLLNINTDEIFFNHDISISDIDKDKELEKAH